MKKRSILLILALVLTLVFCTAALAEGTETEGQQPGEEATPVAEVTLASVSVAALPTKLEYLCTDMAVDPAGGVLTLLYSDSTTSTVEMSAATLSALTGVEGANAVTVTYEGLTTQFNVTVVHAWNEGEVTTEPTATTEGEKTYACTLCETGSKTEPIPATSVAHGTCGENLTWALSEEGVLAISGTGEMRNYSNNDADRNDAPWHDYIPFVKHVVIENGVTTIGKYAFKGCNTLVDIAIPESVKRIDAGAFAYCGMLKDIVLPDSLEDLGDDVFMSCNKLVSVNIPDGVRKIGNATFWACRSLTELTIPDGVTEIGELAFMDCVSLVTINIPESVKKIDRVAFSGCSSLKKLTVHGAVAIGSTVFAECGFETAGPIGSGSDLEFGWTESIPDYAFAGCDSLESIIIPVGVKNIGAGAFQACSSLTNITIPAGVETIQDRTFYDCNNIAEIVIPGNVRSIGGYAFGNCRALTRVTIPNGIKMIGNGAFWGCRSLEEILFEGDAPMVGSHAFIEVNATAYYCRTKNWTEDDFQDYGGKITWHGVCSDYSECTPEIDLAVPPTFETTGLTEGSHCSVCNRVIVKQEIVPILEETAISIESLPSKLVYYKEEELSTEGLCVKVIYNNGSSADISSEVEISGFTSTTAGEHTITVSYNGMDDGFKVYVFGFANVSLSLDGRVIINFYAKFPGAQRAGYTPGIMFFTDRPDEAAIESAYDAGNGMTDFVMAGDGSLMFSYNEVDAKEMNDVIYAVLYADLGDGNVVFGTPSGISVAQYVSLAFNQYADPELQTMLVDMLNYGSAAQLHFKYRTADLANSSLNSAQKELATTTVPELTSAMKLYNDELSSNLITIRSASLSLDNEITINFYAGITGDIASAELLIFDGYTEGGTYDKTTAIRSTQMVESNGSYAGFIPNIVAKAMRDNYHARIHVVFEDGSEAYSGIAQYSVETYAYQVRNGASSAETLKNLTEAMMKYGDSAAVYFNK